MAAPASASTVRLATISASDTSPDPMRSIIVVGAVTGMKERTLATPPSGALRITLEKKVAGMIAGRRTRAERGPASRAEVVADPTPARITANRKYPVTKNRAT